MSNGILQIPKIPILLHNGQGEETPFVESLPPCFYSEPCFPLSSIACLWVRWRLPHYRHSKRIPDETGIHDTKRGKR